MSDTLVERIRRAADECVAVGGDDWYVEGSLGDAKLPHEDELFIATASPKAVLAVLAELAEAQRNKAEQARHCQELTAQLAWIKAQVEERRDGWELHLFFDGAPSLETFEDVLNQASTGEAG